MLDVVVVLPESQPAAAARIPPIEEAEFYPGRKGVELPKRPGRQRENSKPVPVDAVNIPLQSFLVHAAPLAQDALPGAKSFEF